MIPGWQPGLIWQLAEKLPQVVDLPDGKFLMGEMPDDKFADDTERPAHSVTIVQRVAMSVSVVTEFDWALFRAGEPATSLPKVGVSQIEAMQYCNWLSERTECLCRLPSEAEWEFAAFAGTRQVFPRGDILTPEDANFLYDERGNRLGPGKRTPPGTYPANAFALHDMLGNVCEWMLDPWHPNYLGAPDSAEAWLAGGWPDTAVIRGGAWDYLPRLLRPTHRDWLGVNSRRDNLGFRFVVERS